MYVCVCVCVCMCVCIISFIMMVKNLPANARNPGSIPESGRSHGGGNKNPLQYSHLGNTMDRGAWWVTVHSIPKESDMS